MSPRGRPRGPAGPRKRWRYFIYGEKLHKMLAVNRADDEVLAWCYPDHKKIFYSWADVRRNGYKAMTYQDVGNIVGRSAYQVRWYVYNHRIPKPQQTYSLSTGNRGIYFFTKTDVYNLYEYMRTHHMGRPRKDGGITVRNIPTASEVRRAMESGIFTYARTDDGRYVPIWEAEEY